LRDEAIDNGFVPLAVFLIGMAAGIGLVIGLLIHRR